MKEAFKIIVLCVVSAVTYGIVQDLITTRVCVEYFTIGHAPVWGGAIDPTILAMTWGVLATWWVGLGLGIPAAWLARAGSRPKLTWRDVRRPVVVLMLVVGLSALMAGVLAFFILPRDFESAGFPKSLPAARHHAYAVDLAAHNAAYWVGFAGGVVCLGWIWWKRGREERRLLRNEIDSLRMERDRLLAELEAAKSRTSRDA